MRLLDKGLEERPSPPDPLEGYISVVIPPLVVLRTRDLSVLEGIRSQIEHSGSTEAGEGIGPDIELAGPQLFAEHDLPSGRAGCLRLQDVLPHSDQLGVVVKVIELVAIPP
jgi:hypothetical protein